MTTLALILAPALVITGVLAFAALCRVSPRGH